MTKDVLLNDLKVLADRLEHPRFCRECRSSLTGTVELLSDQFLRRWV